MLTLTVTYITNGEAGAREALIKELEEANLMEAIRNEDGCIQYKFYLGVDNQAEMSLLEKWESQEKIDAHLAAPHMDEFRAVKGKYVIDTVIEKYPS